MKNTHGLCAASLLTLIAIATVFIGYATHTLPQHKQTVITTSPPYTTGTLQGTTGTAEATPETSALRKKGCRCCAERSSKFRDKMDKYVQRKKAAALPNLSE